MSLESSVWIQTDATPEKLRRALEGVTPFRSVEGIAGIEEMVAEGSSLSILPVKSLGKPTRRVARGTDLCLSISSTDSDSRTWSVNATRTAVALLHAFPSDLLYLHLDTPALVRKEGRLVLNRRCGIWDEGVEPNVLSLIDLPYEWGDIPVT